MLLPTLILIRLPNLYQQLFSVCYQHKCHFLAWLNLWFHCLIDMKLKIKIVENNWVYFCKSIRNFSNAVNDTQFYAIFIFFNLFFDCNCSARKVICWKYLCTKTRFRAHVVLLIFCTLNLYRILFSRTNRPYPI